MSSGTYGAASPTASFRMHCLPVSRRAISRDFGSQLLKGPPWLPTSGHSLLRIVHIQRLIQGGVKRLPILAQHETALLASMCFSIPHGWTKALSGMNFSSTRHCLQKNWPAKNFNLTSAQSYSLCLLSTGVDSKFSVSTLGKPVCARSWHFLISP